MGPTLNFTLGYIDLTYIYLVSEIHPHHSGNSTPNCLLSRYSTEEVRSGTSKPWAARMAALSRMTAVIEMEDSIPSNQPKPPSELRQAITFFSSSAASSPGSSPRSLEESIDEYHASESESTSGRSGSILPGMASFIISRMDISLNTAFSGSALTKRLLSAAIRASLSPPARRTAEWASVRSCWSLSTLTGMNTASEKSPAEKTSLKPRVSTPSGTSMGNCSATESPSPSEIALRTVLTGLRCL